jgi:glycosyltransferase involved in cell wall biosynthesis
MAIPIVVYFNGTFVNQQNGAHARVAELLNFLSKQSSDITLYSYANHPDCPWDAPAIEKFRKAYPSLQLRLESYTSRLRLMTRVKNFALSTVPHLGPRILRWIVPGETPEYFRLQNEKPNAVWVVNYADGLTQLNGLPGASHIIVEMHDLKFLLHSKGSNTSPTSFRSLLRLRNERALLETASALVTIAPLEKAFVELLVEGAKKFYIPSYIDRPIHASYADYFEFDLLFMASANTFNIRGFTKFVGQNAAWLGKYKIGVAGLICDDEEIIALAHDHANLSLLGYVDDAADLYRVSKAVISPTDGTGLKVKVIEALSHGKPVLGSAHTREGLPGDYRSCVFPIDQSHAEAILENEANRQEAERAAIAYARGLTSRGDAEALAAFIQSS